MSRWSMCMTKKAKPIFGLAGLFQCDFKFRDKVRAALSILGFVDVGANRSRGTGKLACHICAFGNCDIIDHVDDANGEVEREVYEFVVRHRDAPPEW